MILWNCKLFERSEYIALGRSVFSLITCVSFPRWRTLSKRNRGLTDWEQLSFNEITFWNKLWSTVLLIISGWAGIYFVQKLCSLVLCRFNCSPALILIIFGPNCFQCCHFLLKLDRHKIKHDAFSCVCEECKCVLSIVMEKGKGGITQSGNT